MDYVSALIPPVVMAVAFTALIVTMVKSQGGANKSKEDAAVDAALAARTEAEGPAPERETA
ncbi:MULTISPECIES: hypothetical protein [Streptomyces]|uniref:Uncharacterized protein n=1 Tax=Streptomyces violaceusniger (strain Tu 4113) TaxID=653045 RepID=G2P1B0_STRV4|nr:MULTISPECIES: hypothetical protein [Streptomyces]AEM88175.1 hypothetical protein Strvi_8874 [Streptomyces violaceusniger Tu 4113]MBO3674140.1 hypothetical protein [Streptomyces sp. NEAU-YJ-81]